MRKKLLIFTSLVIGICLLIVAYQYWQYQLPLISPLSFIETYITPPTRSTKQVYGFFPYWNLKVADRLRVNELTHFAYFSISLNPDGTIEKRVNPQELEPGWNKLNSSQTNKLLYQVKLLKKTTDLVVTAMDQDLIDSILSSPEHTDTAIKSILLTLKQFNFDGLNIDFEYTGTPPEVLRNKFTEFVRSVRTACLSQNQHCTVSVDVFGDSANKIRLTNIKDLSPIVDKIIVMAYDYYRKSSTQAGPIAPLRGKCEPNPTSACLEQDISFNLATILSLAPPEKIILGIPFYGYEWQTASTDFLANTYPKSGALATYQRIISLFSDSSISSLSASWSSSTQSPYLIYSQDNNIFQVHFESPQSLELKLKLVDNLNLGGIAIWALGYETPYLDLWQSISDWQKQPPTQEPL